MSDRAWLFLGSLLLIFASLGGTVWLAVSGNIWDLDGLFMLLVFLTTALAFALYVWDLLNLTKAEIEKELAPKPAPKKAAPQKSQEA
jgi:hypothetical protein